MSERRATKTQRAAPDTPRTVWTDWLQATPLDTPDETTWSELAAHIALHPPLESEVALLDAALAGWPDILRAAPEPWLVAASRRKQTPYWWSLARTVHYQYAFGKTSVNLTPARLRWLLTSPSMSGIRHLTLRYYDKLSEALREGLSQSQGLAGLRTLDLESCGLGSSGLQAVSAATWLTELEGLNLDHRFFGMSWSQSDPEAAGLLRGASHLSKLTDLRLNLLGGEALLEAVLTAPHLAGVTTLHLGGGSCSDALLHRLAADPRRWRELDLSGDALTAAGAQALADAPGTDSLERLRLSGPIGIDGVLALLDRERLPTLRSLVLHDTGVRDAEASRLEGHPRLEALDHFMCGSRALSRNIVVSKQ